MKYSNKKYYQTLLLLLTILTVYSLPLNATVRYVSKTGTSTPPYLTWETSADSIQKCINISVFGDTIYVANGVYQEQVVMIDGLSLIGAGTDSCIVDSRSLVSAWNDVAVEVKDSCLLKWFKIIATNNLQNGMGIAGSGSNSTLVSMNRVTNAAFGIFLDASFYGISNFRVYKNVIENVRTGIEIFNSNSKVSGNVIYTTLNNQYSPRGINVGAFTNFYGPIIDSNYIVAINGYGIYKSVGARPIIRNNEIITIGIGIQLSTSDSAIVNNNSIIVPGGIESAYGIYNTGTQYLQLDNNQISGDFYRILYIGSDNKIKNNVVSNAEGEIRVWGGQNIQYQYNNVWDSNVSYAGFAPDTTNISVDPMIVNDDTTQGELDFHLQMFSPLINAGDPNIMDKDSTRSDIGLYGGLYGESYLYQDLAPRPPHNLSVIVDTLITLSWNKNTEADFNHYNLYRDTTANFNIDTTKLIASITDTFYLHKIPTGIESLYFKLTGVDNQGNESNPSEEVGILITSVMDEWKPVNNYMLYQNYPNPFNPSTRIGYKLKERGYVKLYVYDVKGELVEVLVNQYQEAGYYEVEFNGDGKIDLIKVKNPFVSGVYLCQIIVQSENGIPVFSDMIKMILLK